MSSDIRVVLLAKLFTHLPQEELESVVKEMDEAVKSIYRRKISGADQAEGKRDILGCLCEATRRPQGRVNQLACGNHPGHAISVPERERGGWKG